MPGEVPVYGIDKELALKQAAKYDVGREKEVKEWINSVLGRTALTESSDFIADLKDGVVLAELMNAVVPNSCKINTSTMPFKQMENINGFLTGASKLGVHKNELFQTVDLYEAKNPAQVLDAIFAFARHAHKGNPSLPLLGPKLADKHKVNFSDEQLNAGKYVPSQQTGHNAALKAIKTGATASGINFGARRDHGGAPAGTQQPVSAEPAQTTGYASAVHAIKTGATASGMSFGARREIGGRPQ